MTTTMKTCPGCKVSLPRSDFNRGNDAGGVQSYCKPCMRERVLRAYYRRKAKNPDGFPPVTQKVCSGCRVMLPAAAFHLQHFVPSGLNSKCKECVKIAQACSRYGLTRDEYDALSKVCEICGTSRTLGVDHCHKGGQVRGMLCRACNAALGMFGEDPVRLEAAAAYLRR